MSTEKPKYTSIKKEGDYELRQYDGYIRASVTVVGDSYNNSGNTAFSSLADYIFGNNKTTDQIKMTSPVISQQKDTSHKIAMTSPVTSTKIDSTLYEVSFIMPSEYSMESIPKPVNPLVTLEAVPSYKAAAIRFSGYSSQKVIDNKTKLLFQWIEENGLTRAGTPMLARYDPPWMPGFIRKNEVIINVMQKNDE